MLTRLYIRNFALISELEVPLGPGLTVITGETGAGKSILLDAVGLLLGDQAEGAHFKDPSLSCVVEMEFSTADPEVRAKCAELTDDPDLLNRDASQAMEFVLRREINPRKRSRCLINDAAVALRDLKALAALLLDLSGQEEAVAVDRRQTQILLLDEVAGCEVHRHGYAQAYRHWKTLRKELEDCLADLEQRKREEERTMFFWKELQDAPLDAWEELGLLESALAVQENALESGEKLRGAEAVLDEGTSGNGGPPSVSDTLRALLQTFGGLESKDAEVGAWTERLRSLLYQTQELARDAADLADQRIPDLEATALLREQLDGLQGLLHKHRLGTLEALRGLRARLGEALGSTPGVDEAKAVLEEKEAHALEEARQAALRLHRARTTALADLSQRCEAKLARLGMEHARLLWKNEPALVLPSNETSDVDWQGWLPQDALQGLDQSELWFSANPGQDPRPLAQVASGGEKSRLLLALKSLVREEGRNHTRLFDEIDAGISGETALRMGQMLAEMGQHQQIILITHLPQIAALGDAHWHITKEVANQQTQTALHILDADQRRLALARMIGGDRYGAAALEQAADLLKNRKAP
jgi:DNA repair protein RecN (Recombination protein N)